MRRIVRYAALLLPMLLLPGCGTDTRLTFSHDVFPILEAKCVDCHAPPNGKGYRKSGLNMESYEALMKGSLYGPVVVPGDSLHSVLIMFIEGRVDESILMPHKDDEQLNDLEIATLRSWVEQGAAEN